MDQKETQTPSFGLLPGEAHSPSPAALQPLQLPFSLPPPVRVSSGVTSSPVVLGFPRAGAVLPLQLGQSTVMETAANIATNYCQSMDLVNKELVDLVNKA